MKIQAKIPLVLSNVIYGITLKYETVQKASFDCFLIASLIHNAQNKEEAFKYIDEITGGGSLNLHFKKMYDEISQFSEEKLNRILSDSLYPVTNISEQYSFKYYPMFDVSNLNGKYYEGNLKNNIEILKETLMPKNKECTFIGIDFDFTPSQDPEDYYDVIFNDDKIIVELGNGKTGEIPPDDLRRYYVRERANTEGLIITNFEDLQGKSNLSWKVLTDQIISNVRNQKFVYYDKDKTRYTLHSKFFKESYIVNTFGLYFYGEDKLDYSEANKNILDKCLNKVVVDGLIGALNNNALEKMLNVCSNDYAQLAIKSYLRLGRKNSKKICEIALEKMKNGLFDNWGDECLNTIKTFVPNGSLELIYRANSSLTFTDEEIAKIDNGLLKPEDLIRKNDYFQEAEKVKKLIKEKLADMIMIRNPMRKLKNKDKISDKLKKFLNEKNHKDYTLENMTLAELNEEYKIFEDIYNNNYLVVQERLKNQTKKTQ